MDRRMKEVLLMEIKHIANWMCQRTDGKFKKQGRVQQHRTVNTSGVFFHLSPYDLKWRRRANLYGNIITIKIIALRSGREVTSSRRTPFKDSFYLSPHTNKLAILVPSLNNNYSNQ